MKTSLARLAALATFALTLALFLAPDGAGPRGGVTFPGMDKLAHAGLFATLAFLARRSFENVPAWRLFVLLLAYGLLVELAQAYIPGRSPELMDLVADVAGALAGLWATQRIQENPAGHEGHSE